MMLPSIQAHRIQRWAAHVVGSNIVNPERQSVGFRNQCRFMRSANDISNKSRRLWYYELLHDGMIFLLTLRAVKVSSKG